MWVEKVFSVNAFRSGVASVADWLNELEDDDRRVIFVTAEAVGDSLLVLARVERVGEWVKW